MKPFKHDIYNKLEEREILCSIASLYAGYLFTSDFDIAWGIQVFAFACVIMFNYLFFSMLIWAYLDAMNLKYLKRITPWLHYLLFTEVGRHWKHTSTGSHSSINQMVHPLHKKELIAIPNIKKNKEMLSSEVITQKYFSADNKLDS